MFERTKSFWRRLLQRPQDSGVATLENGQAERRVWIRYGTSLETSYKPAGAPESTHLMARVRNISLGGINLVGTRAFQLGELVTVELPGATEDTCCSVLACVVHCEEEPSGGWSLGCAFSRELSDEDLANLGGRRERTDPPDQRLWKRFAGRVTANVQLVAADDPQRQPAKVLDISASGVGLLVEREIENGSLLSVELHNAAGTVERTMLACVVHVTEQGAEAWALGCNFIRSLSEEDLQALV